MFQWVGTLMEGRLQEDVAQANARIAQQQAEAQAASIMAEREKLAEQQRGAKAQQRMSVASRGGLMGGTDLLTLAEEAKKMQMDQLEMVRQRDIALTEGMNRAQMMKWQAKQQKRAGYWTAGAQMLGDVGSLASLGLSAGLFSGGGAAAGGAASGQQMAGMPSITTGLV
jgi:hypothetical protein